MVEIEQRLPVRVPVAGVDLGELRPGDPAEIECSLVTDVADRKHGLAIRPAELKAGGPLLDAVSRCEPIELDLG